MQPAEGSDQAWNTGFAAHRRVLLLASGVALTMGGIFMLTGFVIERQAVTLAHLLTEIGKVVVVTSVVGVIFEFVMHERFVARVKQQVASIEEQVRRLEESIVKLQKTVAITAGAIESGLSAVYSERQSALEAIERLLQNASPGSELRLLGISLGDFLCPHGRLYQATIRALQRGMRVKALIVDLNSDAAKTRAQREEHAPETPVFKSIGWDDWYHTTRCYDELKTATDAAQVFKRRFTVQPETTPGECTFEYKTYDLSPLCFLAVHDDTMFLESYHYAGRGGEAPILQIAKVTSVSGRTRLFDIYARHFDVLWDLPRAEGISAEPPKLPIREEPQVAQHET